MAYTELIHLVKSQIRAPGAQAGVPWCEWQERAGGEQVPSGNPRWGCSQPALEKQQEQASS